MKVQIYAIFDNCSGIYEKPFFHTADDVVRREFQDVALSADHPINKHPEHYSLWRLGNFDNTDGKIINEENECLWQAVEAIAQSVKIMAPANDGDGHLQTHMSFGETE